MKNLLTTLFILFAYFIPLSLHAQVLNVSVDFEADNPAKCDLTTPVVFTPTVVGITPGLVYTWDFGDGTMVTQTAIGAVSHIYQNVGVYTVSLTVSNALDSVNETKVDYITVNKGPSADFIQSVNVGCEPLNVDFSISGIPGNSPIVGISWDFGDGGSASQNPNPTHTYTNSGFFDVKMSLRDANGCVSSVIVDSSVQVVQSPNVSITSFDRFQCGDSATVTFFSTTLPTNLPIVNYSWDFGNGQTSLLANPSVTYANAGTYDVSLTVSTADGCQASVTRNDFVDIQDTEADFSNINDTICVGESVSFANTSTGSTTFEWDFGDGGSSTSANPSHIYLEAGTYDVQLIASAGSSFGGCTDTVKKTALITVAENPSANFFSFPTPTQNGSVVRCNPPLSIFMLASVFGANDKLYWDFGNGDTAMANGSNQGPFPADYTASGAYDVQLIATNIAGCADTMRKGNYVIIEDLQPDFSSDVSSGCLPLTVSFTDQSVAYDSISSWTWYFGDGTVLPNVQNPIHTYTSAGIFDVKLEVTTLSGCTEIVEFQDYIEAKAVLTPDLTAFPRISCPDDPISFWNQTATNGASSNVSWLWDFGDGNTSTLMNPNPHIYEDTGFFDITLIVDNLGCKDTVMKSNYVNIQKPVALFSYQIPLACNTGAYTVYFEDESIDAETWFWNFGDNTVSSLQSPTHIYTSPGVYTIELQVTNSLTNCIDTKTITIDVTPEPLDFSVNQNSSYVNDTLFFTPNYTDLDAYFWDFGDGNTSTDIYPNHAYGDTGSYAVSLIVNTATGCADTVVKIDYIQVNDTNYVDLTGCCVPPPLYVSGTSFDDLVGVGTDEPLAKLHIADGDLGSRPALKIEGADSNSPNGYKLYVEGAETFNNNQSNHTRLTTGDASSRLSLTAASRTDKAPRLQFTGPEEGSNPGWGIFDYGSREVELPNASFKIRHHSEAVNNAVDMIQAEGRTGVYLAPAVGNVGVGTNDPEEKLHVAGTIRSDMLVGGGNVCADADGNLIVSGPCDPAVAAGRMAEPEVDRLEAIIEAQNDRIEQLEAQNARIETLLQQLSLSTQSSMLLQNIPNPTEGATHIGYVLAEGATTAWIEVSEVRAGAVLQRMMLNPDEANGKVELNTENWAAGVYVYVLYVDGKKADSRRMVVR